MSETDADGLIVEQNTVGFLVKAANGNECFLTNERVVALYYRIGLTERSPFLAKPTPRSERE